MITELGTYLMIAVVSALASAAFCVTIWVCWLRHVQNQLTRIQRMMYDQPIRKPVENKATFVANTVAKKPELVAQFKVKDGQQTVSVLESDGKRFLRVDGDLSWKQRLKMLRYLKAEGFMD